MGPIRNFVLWTIIGGGLLFFGGLAAHGYRLLMTPCGAANDCGLRMIDWFALGHVAVGGGVAIGLIGLTLTLASPRGVGWGLGLLAIGSVLFLIFVWPTPFKYYRTADRRWIQVHRFTGESHILPDRAQDAAASVSASQR
ncbi:MAG TPA: hypothetical protein VGL09_21530 [Methylomirabilota bacterium]|jgi:hypothetical protein